MIRLLVADDHPIFREGLKRLLSEQDDLVVAHEAADVAGVMAGLRAQPIDVAVLDLSMHGRDGVEMISRAKSLQPNMRILILTMHDSEHHATQALRAGADGYMTKENAADELVLALRRLHRGERYVCPAVAERLALSIAMHEPDDMRHTRLSAREFKVFEMLVAGKRGWEIAQELTLSEKTVSTHKAHVLRKMNVTNRTELLLYAVKHQLVSV
jgi:DNA-binding NarL/FixJ family response regulator